MATRELGPGGPGQVPLRQVTAVAEHKRLSGALLAPRETEVLSWLAQGKIHRDLGDILGGTGFAELRYTVPRPAA